MPEILGSFAPSSFVAGGLRDDFDAKIIEARAEFFDYQGKSVEITAIKIVFEEFDSKDQIEQMYSFSSTADFVPNESDGGDTVVRVGTHEVPFNSSNFAFFLSKLVSLGFPEDKMQSKLSFLVGVSGHWNRQAAPVRAGMEPPPTTTAAGQRKGAPTILTLSKKLKWPWEPGTGSAAGTRATTTTTGARTGVRTRTASPTTTAPATAPTPPSAPTPATVVVPDTATFRLDSDDIAVIVEAIDGIVVNSGDTAVLVDVKVAVFKSFNAKGLDAASCNTAVRAITPDFLSQHGYMLDGEGKAQTITRM